MSITLDDFCLIDTNEVRNASTKYLEEDPACPRDALLRSNAVYDPNSEEINDLARGKYTSARFKHWDEGSLFDDATPGLNCPEECVKPGLTEECATLVTWSKCVSEAALIQFCREANPTIDPFALAVSMYEDIRDCERTKYMLAILRGIYNTVVAAETATPGVTQILADMSVESADGTSDISIENLAAAEGMLIVSTDIHIVSHKLSRKLRAAGYHVCCDQNGNVQRRIPDLMAPGGQTIIAMDKKFDPFFELADDKFLMIGLKDRSIIFKDGNPAQGSDLFRKWNPMQFNDPSASGGCDEQKLYIRDRSVIHTCGYKYEGPSVRCDGVSPSGTPTVVRDLAFFMSAKNWSYPHVVMDGCGWDKSCVTFVCGTCPTLVAPVAAKAAVKA